MNRIGDAGTRSHEVLERKVGDHGRRMGQGPDAGQSLRRTTFDGRTPVTRGGTKLFAT